MQTNNQRSFGTYIYKVLKRVHTDTGMSTPALESLDSSMRILSNKIGEQSRNFAFTENLKTINIREIEGSVKSLLPVSLSDRVVEFANNAVDKFLATNVPTTTQEPSSTKQTRENRAGLVFSVSLSEKYLRNRGCNVGSCAPVYLAAVLEYITSRILELSGEVAKENKMVRIKVRHIHLAIFGDSELSKTFSKMQIVLLGGGVMPYIDSRLLKSRNAKRKQVHPPVVQNDKDGQPLPAKPKVHKFRPGTVSLRRIRTFQKSSENQLCKVHMHNACNMITSGMHPDVRMTQEARDSLHTLIEQKMVESFIFVNELCLHAGRQTVSDEDFDLFFRLKDVNTTHTYDLDFKEPGIRRLAQRAGVIRMGKDTWKKATLYIESLLVKYLRDAVNMMTLQNRTVINIKVLSEGLSLNGIELAVVARKIKRKNKLVQSESTGENLNDVKVDCEEEEDAVVDDVQEEPEEVLKEEPKVVEVPKVEKVVEKQSKTKQKVVKKSPETKVKREKVKN